MPVSLGFVRKDQPVKIGEYKLALGPTKRYTGMQVYYRPQEWVLVLGSILMFAGLVWLFVGLFSGFSDYGHL